MSFFKKLKDRFRQMQPKLPIVTITEQEVSYAFNDGTVQKVRWDDLQAVVIETTDGGPFADDWCWTLFGSGDSTFCTIPLGAEGESNLLPRLQKFPNFDSEAVGHAARCTSNKVFLCWEREDCKWKDSPMIVAARNYRDSQNQTS